MIRAVFLLVLLGLGPGAVTPGERSAPDPEAPATPQEGPARAIPPLELRWVPDRSPSPADSAEADEPPVVLGVSLASGPPGPPPRSPGAARPLSPDRVRELLARLPDAPGGPSDPPPPTWRPEVDPGPAGAEVGEEAPRVLSVLPAGETEVAPGVTVVFSRPMVPLGRDAEPVEGPPPVRLEPEVPGTWRWLDVRTLRFEADAGRLPSATAFTVTVPAGLTAADGTPLATAHRATFATAGPRVLGGHPNDRSRAQRDGLARPDAVVLLVFDQAVEPERVVAATRLEADGVARPLRAVDEEGLEAHDRRMAEAARRAGEGRWVAFRPAEPLPAEADVVVRVGAELPSLEGPRPAGRAQELRFRVRGALELTGTRCGLPPEHCTPTGLWWMEFTNPLAADPPAPELVRVRPEVEGLRVATMGQRFFLAGDFRPHTRYRIRVAGALRDRFGQTLGADTTLSVPMGPPSPEVAIPGAPFLVLDPEADQRLEALARSVAEVRVEVYPVEPREWLEYRRSLDTRMRGWGLEPWTPGRPPAASWTETTPGGAERFSRMEIDLSRALGGDRDHALVVLRAVSPDSGPAASDSADDPAARLLRLPLGSPTASAWVQSTSFAVGAAWDPGELRAWAVGLADRRPLAGVEVTLPRSGVRGRTDDAGLARIPLTSGADSLLLARRNGEIAILPAPVARVGGEAWTGDEGFPSPLWFTLTDRGLYRPGETLEGHGWIRARAGDPPDLAYPASVDSVRWRISDARRRQTAGTVPVSPTGWFHVVAPIPEDARSGAARLEVAAVVDGDLVGGWSETTGFRIEAFRRPTYEVTGEIDPGPHVAGDVIEARARALYYDGAALQGSPVEWRVRTEAEWWSPPGWRGWYFGWSHARDPEVSMGRARHTGETDAAGRHVLRVGTGALARPMPARVHAAVEVRDVDRQAGSTDVQAVVHPADRAVGVRTKRYWVRAGETLPFDVAIVDLDGAPATAAGGPEVRVILEADPARPGAPETEETVPVTCDPGAEEEVGEHVVRPLRCSFRPPTPGAYRIEAEVTDARGRHSVTELRRWVLSSTSPWVVGTPVDSDLVVSADREVYQPGDTARLMVASAFHPMEGLLTVFRHGIREARPFRLEGPGTEVRVPILPSDAGGVEVQVALASPSGALDARSATERLRVETDARRLAVDVRPERAAVRPGDSVTVRVAVRDHEGRPAAGGEVALWVVDEAVLNLVGYELEDPVATMHPLRRTWRERLEVFLPQEAVRWLRRPLGPGVVSAELLDAITGTPLQAVQVFLDGEERSPAARGRLLLRDVAPGRHRLVLRDSSGTFLDRIVDVPPEGLDLGTLLLAGDPGEGRRMERRELRAAFSVQGVVAASAVMETGQARVRRAGGPGSRPDPVAVRRLFRALASFEPAVALDGDGRATVTVRLPDTMTRYRIFAVATHEPTRFGTGEAAVTARHDLVVRASPPRFLHPGDRPELTVVVQNTSSGPLDTEVAARTSGLDLEGPLGYRVRLPAGGRSELRFPARGGATGTAALEVIAVASGPGGERTDAVGVSVPVRPPLAPRAAGLHRRVGPGERLQLDLETPARAYPGFGGVDVALSTTALLPLVEALRSLCLEPVLWPGATAARVLGLTALDGQLDALRASDLPPPDELRRRTAADVDRLTDWLRPHLSPGAPGPESGFLGPLSVVHAVHALVAAEEAGYPVSSAIRRAIRRYLEAWWERWNDRTEREASDRPASGWETAMPAYVLHLGTRTGAIVPGPDPAEWIASLEPPDLPVEVLAWLLAPAAALPDAPGLADRLLGELENRALTTGATVTFRQGGRETSATTEVDVERLVLASARRSDAAALAALVDHAPDHRFLPGLVRGLLGHRDGTAAAGAHESGWVLFALGRWAAVHEADPAALVVRAEIDGRPLGQVAHLGSGGGDTAVAATRTAPLPPPGRPVRLEVAREGSGPLFVRAGVRYAPVVTPETPAEARGFVVSRRYEAVDDSGAVVREPDGAWRVRAGARVRVRVTFTAPSRRYQVRLVDPLPAGLEAVNPRLRGTGFSRDPAPPPPVQPPEGAVSAPLGATLANFPYGWDLTDVFFRWRGRWGLWASHEELRDDRMEAYTPYLPAGTYQTTYLARATTPGDFLAAPPRVEESEHPETFGQGRPVRVRVVP